MADDHHLKRAVCLVSLTSLTCVHLLHLHTAAWEAGEREQAENKLWLNPSQHPTVQTYTGLCQRVQTYIYYYGFYCVFYLHAQWKERADYLDPPHLIHLGESWFFLAHYITYNNGFHWQDEGAVSGLLCVPVMKNHSKMLASHPVTTLWWQSKQSL